MHWPQSLRARLTLWYTLVLGAPLVAFAGASVFVLDRALLRRADAFLDETLGAFTTELASEQQEEPTAPQAIQASLSDVQFRDVRLAIFDTTGVLITAGKVDTSARYVLRHPVDLARVGAELHARIDTARNVFTVGKGERAFRVTTEPTTIFGTRYVVAAAYPLHRDRETMEAVGTSYTIAIPLLLLIASVGGYFLAGRSLSPVAAMSARAAEISSTNLNERLPVGQRRDELGALALVVNSLLERLEQSFAQQRRFMADASHELRTPVAVLRTEADVTLSRPNRTEGEYRESVAVMRDSARRLGRIVDDLFLLARADAGHLPLRRAPLYLEDVVDESARAIRALAQERDVRVELLPLDDSPFDGDADLLGRLLLNLLDNAIKHSPAGGTVTLSLTRHAAEYHIRVADVGPGIPPDAQSQIFERFFRADKTRSREGADAGETSGAGLGLAIGRWIAEAHGGRLEAPSVRRDRLGIPHRTASTRRRVVGGPPRDIAPGRNRSSRVGVVHRPRPLSARLRAAAAIAACLTPVVRVDAQQGSPLTRQAAIASAIQRGGRLRLAGADTATAAAQLRVAGTFENPVVTAEYSKSAPQYHLTLDLPFDYPWLRQTRIAAAQATRAAAQYRYAFERAAVALDADTTYTRALAAQAKLALSHRNAVDADSLRSIAVARRNAGDASDLDVELATVVAGQQANTAAGDSLTLLSTLLDLQTVIGVATTEPSITLVDSLSAPTDSIVARSGQPLPIAAAEAALRSASLGVRLQRRSIFAATSITTGFETHDPAGDEKGILPVLGFSIPFPLFNRNSAQVAVAQAEQFRAQAERDVAILETRAGIARTERERAIALANVARDQTLVASANRVAVLSLTAYREGAAPLATAIEAQRNAREILSQYIDDLAAAWIATAALRVRTLTAGTSP